MNKYPIIIVAVLIIALWYLNRPRGKTLYDRLGGVYSIAAVVDHFSDALIDNPIVGRNSQNKFLRHWHRKKLDRLPGLKFMRTLWVCALSGGPFKYSPTVPGKCPFSLENSHKKLEISDEEFDAVAAELSNSLDVFGVPQKEKQEVLAAFAAHKGEVVDGFYMAHGLPRKKIHC
jgi:hemoglobin